MKLSNYTVQLQADALGDQANNGVLRIYSGTEPATADAALAGNTLLAELTLAADAFGASAIVGNAARITAAAITQDSDADNGGVATFYRMFKTGGTQVLTQGTVSATGGGGDLQLVNTTIVQHATIQVTSFTHDVPKQ